MGNNVFPMQQLGPLCAKIGSGATPRGGSNVYLDQGEISLIRSQNVRNEHFTKSGLVFIEQKHADQLANVIVENNDVLLNITGDSVARCCQVDPFFLPARVNQHVAIIRPEPERLDSRFLRYFLVSPYMQSFMLSWAGSGGTRNALTKGMIESFKVPVPEISEQKAIAHVLGALDDRIELNRRMNETLEGMAQALFKSWFVDFDPVIDNALASGKEIPAELSDRAAARAALGDKRQPLPAEIRTLFPDEFTDSTELGWIPKGWEVASYSKYAALNQASWTKKNTPQNVQYVDLSNTKDGKINLVVPYAFADAPSRARRILKKHDTIIGTVRPGNRSFAYVHKEGLTGSTGFAVMTPKEKRCRSFVYLGLTQDKVIENFAHLADGAAYPAIRPEVVANFESVFPTADLIKSFDSCVYPWIEQMGKHEEQAGTLAQLRDILLPKLLSGEIRIPEAEKQAEELAL